MNLAPVWLLRSVVQEMHREQIAEHGGADGLRDAGLLESALHRPENLLAYGDPDIFDLAAAYAAGIARNHPFFDGNKRTSLLAAYVFLRLNGRRLVASQDDAVTAVLRLATGELAENGFADWLRAHAKPD